MFNSSPQRQRWLRRLAPWAAVLLYLLLTLPQLNLPGLHYDEAKEAGVNAMEMLLGQDVQAFRAAGLQIGTVFLPLMVQDYIGALNVYLALPLLALFGINLPALRLLAVGCGLLTLVLVGQLGQELSRFSLAGRQPGTGQGQEIQAGSAGPIAMLLLAVSPSFIFWSRQGVFVTNVVVTLAVATAWMGLRWWRLRRPRDLYALAFLAGLGLWAKLLFAWVLGAMTGVALAAWLLGRWQRRRAGTPAPPPVSRSSLLIAVLLFLLALSPLILFNQQTAGTWRAVFANLGNSYYGVDNTAFLANLQVRLGQAGTLLRSDHLWYLGGPFASTLVPWIAVTLLAGGLWVAWLGYRQRQEGGPLATLLLAMLFALLLVAQSSFTISDLFVTHLAIVQPFLIAPVALAAETLLRFGRQPATEASAGTGGQGRQLVLVATVVGLALWVLSDLRTDLSYHRTLAQTGGLASHSDASQPLAEWLDRRSMEQPLALDWGIEAPVRYLTANRVRPLELFGYEQLESPDAGFAQRLTPFMDEPDRLYLAHTLEDTVFQGRRQALEAMASAEGRDVVEVATFRERSGRPVFVVLQLTP